MTWWHYLLLANVYLTLFFVFYAVFLRKETFFNLNRVYLVSSAILSFLIPLIESDWIKNLFITHQVQQTIYQVGPVVMARISAHTTPDHQLTMGQILGGVYIAGILVLSLRFVYQLAVINWAISQPKSDTSFSFFNQIRIEERDSDNTVITAHEEVHARQWHSADVLLLEAIMIVNWFNPVVYLYRNAVKYIHEFIADRDAIKAGTDKAEYAMLLLSQTFVTPPYQLVNPFFTSSLLKQRIQMMHKNRSHWMMLVKYGLSAPLFALMLILTSATVDKSKTITVINATVNNLMKSPTDGFSNLSRTDQEDLNAVIKEHMAAGHNATTTVDGALPNENNSEVFTNVQRNASFPGGLQAFYDYLWFNMEYPTLARQKNIQGKVFLTFVVEKNGSITDIKVLRGIGGGADEEAVRVLKLMPKWVPGVQNGTVVRQQYTVPISFSLVEQSDNSVNENFSFTKKAPSPPQPKDTANRIIDIKPMRDTTSLEGRYLGNVKPASTDGQYGFVNAKPVAAKKLDVIKDQAIKNLYSEKLTSGVVSIITKHRPFFAPGDLNY